MQTRSSVLLVLCVSALSCACSSSDGGSGAGAAGASASLAGAASSLAGASGSAGALVSGGAPSSGGVPSSGGALATGGMSTVAGAPDSGGASNVAGSGGTGGTLGGAGAASVAGAAGASAGAAGVPTTGSCPAAPVGAPANAITAINDVDTLRVAMGLKCANLVLTLDKSAQAHCDFYAANTGNATCEGGSISPHDEVTGCTGFTGADPGARVKAAGYVGNGWAEVMAFDDDPHKSVAQWINSVWHRTPLLSPWWNDMGYGNAAMCDVIDLGPGTQSPATMTAMYPYAGQTGVPRSFNGAQEGPVPPAPPTGWPSGSPITLYVRNATTVSHSIEVQGSGIPLDHQWIDYKQSDNDSDQVIMYTNSPFTANTVYHVTIAVTINGTPKTFDWTFTTGTAN